MCFWGGWERVLLFCAFGGRGTHPREAAKCKRDRGMVWKSQSKLKSARENICFPGLAGFTFYILGPLSCHRTCGGARSHLFPETVAWSSMGVPAHAALSNHSPLFGFLVNQNLKPLVPSNSRASPCGASSVWVPCATTHRSLAPSFWTANVQVCPRGLEIMVKRSPARRPQPPLRKQAVNTL